MKKNLLFLIIAFASTGIFAQRWTENLKSVPHPTFYDMQKAFNDYYKDRIADWEGDDEYTQFKRWEAFMLPRVYPTGTFSDHAATYRAMLQRNTLRNQTPSTAQFANWQPLGPQQTGLSGVGRIDCIKFDPNNSSTIWVGAASGGIWKSANGGSSWLDMNAGMPILSVADIAIDPGNTNNIYAATGDGYGYVAFANVFWGGTYSIGVVKSTDGGVTWNPTGLSYLVGQAQIINRLLINPNSPNILMAFGTGGINRSTDGGATWTNVLTFPTFYDAEFNAFNSNTIYASSSNGIYQSTDIGATWSLMSGSPTFTGRVSIETTPANASVIYAMDQNKKMVKSTNGGTSWSTMTSPTCTLYGYYDCVLSVSPTDANTVFAAGYTMCKSTNGASSWTTVSGTIHPDHHVLEFLPGSNQTIYDGSDGGFHRTTNQGTNWSDLTQGLQITQFYRLGCAATNASIIYGGAQDNGTQRYNAGTWASVGGADGMEVLVDYTTTNIVYKSTQYGSWSKSTNGGGSFSAIPAAGGAWTSPMVMHPTTNTTLFYGATNVIQKSTNSGTSWSNISGNLTPDDFISLAVAKSNPNVIYAATYYQIWKTTNGGTSWTDITGTLPASLVTMSYIAISATDPNKVWVTFSGYAPGQRVYQSTDGGNTWNSVSTNLPDVPVNCIVYDNNSTTDMIYCGTDDGVFYMDNNSGGWISFNGGLPNVIVNELEIHYGANKLRAATYGRGMWETQLGLNTGSSSPVTTAPTISIYPNPGSGVFHVDVASGSRDESAYISAYNLVGQKLLSTTSAPSQPSTTIDLSSQPEGVYFIEVKTAFETRTQKIILRR